MTLEMLKNNTEIDGFNIIVMDKLRKEYPEKFEENGQMNWKWFEKDIRPHNFIYVRHDKNSLSFTLQKGPVKEDGVNGCQIDTVIAVAAEILKGFNSKSPCRENSLAITKLEEALHWLNARTKRRISEGVEGTNQ